VQVWKDTTLTILRQFIMRGATLEDFGTVQITASDPSSWTGGTITGNQSGHVTIADTSFTIGNVGKDSTVTLDKVTLVVEKNVTAGNQQLKSEVTWLGGTIELTDVAVFDNQGVFVVQPTRATMPAGQSTALTMTGIQNSRFINNGYFLYAPAAGDK